MENKSDILPFDLNSFFGQESIEKAVELFENMQQPFLGGKQLEIDIRLLYHWTRTFNTKANLDNRTKYSFTDLIWYKVVEQLRNAGLDFPTLVILKNSLLAEIELKGFITKVQQTKNYIDNLKITKEEKEELKKLLNKNDAIKDGTTFNILHIIIIECLLKKVPLSLAVFLDGTYIILDKSKEHLYSDEEKNKLLFDTHIVVSVAAILKKFLHSDLSGFVIPKVELFSYPENKLFEVVHSGEYDSIVIHFKDKKMKSMELKKSEDVKQRIIDILEKDQFGEIVVKKHNGVVTKIENTIKVSL